MTRIVRTCWLQGPSLFAPFLLVIDFIGHTVFGVHIG